MAADNKKELYGPGRATRLKGLELGIKLRASHVLRDGEYNIARQKQGPEAWKTSFSADFQGQMLDRSYTLPQFSHVKHNFQLGNDSGQTVPLCVYNQSTTKEDFNKKNAPRTKVRLEDRTVHWPDMAPQYFGDVKIGESEYFQSFVSQARSGSAPAPPAFPKVDTSKMKLPLDPVRFHHQRGSSYRFGSDEKSNLSEQQRAFGRVNSTEDVTHKLPYGLKSEMGTIMKDANNKSNVFRIGDYNNFVGDMQTTTINDYGPRTRDPGQLLASQILQRNISSGQTTDVANELTAYARSVTVPDVFRDALNSRTDQESAHFKFGSDPNQQASLYRKDFSISPLASRAVPRLRSTPDAGKIFQNNLQFSGKPVTTKSTDFMKPPPIMKSGQLELNIAKRQGNNIVLSCDMGRHAADRQISLSHEDYVGPPSGYKPLGLGGERAVPYPFLQSDPALPYPGLARQSEAANSFDGTFSSGQFALERVRSHNEMCRERTQETKRTHFTPGYQTPDYASHHSLTFTGKMKNDASLAPAGKTEGKTDCEFQHLRHSTNTRDKDVTAASEGLLASSEEEFAISVMKSDYKPGKRLTADQQNSVEKFEKLLSKPFSKAHLFHTDNSGRNNYVSTTMDDFIKPETMTGGRKRLAAK